MTGKAKPKKHTAKEIAAKIDAATTNRGGGKAGQKDRLGQEKGGHAKMECPLCKVTAPDVKSMQIHHEARHPKLPFDPDKINNLHGSTAAAPAAAAVASTSKPKPGIRGSLKKTGLMMNESAIAAMNRNEASTASSASSKSLFAVAMDCYDHCLVWSVVLRYLVVL
ncbi:hypothetical protein ACQJBY_065874 [Aegilops geniculata]